MRAATTLLFILLWTINSFGQGGPCTLKLADLPSAPELMGFKLGMTADEVKAKVPQVRLGRLDHFGVSKTTINPDFDPTIDKQLFPGVRTLSLDFLDGRLTSFWVGYDSTFKWQSTEQFVKGISASLRLPDAWSPWKTRGLKLNCTDFQVTVNFIAEGPSFRILDLTAEETVAARRQAKEELDAQAENEAETGIIADRLAKVYYKPGCQPAKEIKETDRIVFKTIEDAEQSGFKPAGHCE